MNESAPGRAPVSAGTWRQVAAVVDGKDIPVGRGTLLTVTPDGYTVTAFGRVYSAGTSTADLTVTPHQSDVTVARGYDAGHTIEQIFRVEGDVLVACAARPGAPRPTEFTSPPGSGRALSVWVRVPARPPASLTPAKWWTILVVSLIFGGGFAEMVGKSLVADLGEWGALAVRVAVSGVLVGALAFGLSHLTTADALTRRTLAGFGVLFGVAFPLTLGVYEGLRKMLEPEHGWLGWGLSLLAATAAGLAAMAALGPLLKRLGVGAAGE